MVEIVAPNKYNNSRIYKICSNLTDKIYIGSTTQTLAQRLSKHVGAYKTNKKNIETNNNYITSIEIIKLGDFSIVLIEECNFNNKEQLLKREGEFIKLHINNVVNKIIAGRTQVEQQKLYYNDNKTEIAERRKQYYLTNKTQIIEYSKQYRTDNKTQLAENRKQYRKDNKTQIAENKKQYRLKQKALKALTI